MRQRRERQQGGTPRLPSTGGSGGANPRLARHRDIERRVVDRDGSAVEVLFDASESPLAWLAKRRDREGNPMLPASAVQAGERLRAQMTLAGMMPRMTSNWAAPIPADRRSGRAGASVELSEAAAAARQRVGRALDAVGPELSGILVDVCGFLKGLEQVERERRWPPRTAKVVLAMALARLAGHYGLSDTARGGRSTIRVWQADPTDPAPDVTPAPSPSRPRP